MNKKILIIDDDKDYASIISNYLLANGYHTSILFRGSDVCEVLKHTSYDCIILDIYLENGASFDLCKEISKFSKAPVIFISNFSGDYERIQSFLSGGVDYLAKPFPLEELKLRIDARMASQTEENTAFNMDEDAYVLKIEGKVVDLTYTEFEILKFLVYNKNKVFTQMEIYSNVWKQDGLDTTHTVQVHISTLRKKLDEKSFNHHYIQTVWGKGYKFINGENN